jgi:hypothetical protein
MNSSTRLRLSSVATPPRHSLTWTRPKADGYPPPREVLGRWGLLAGGCVAELVNLLVNLRSCVGCHRVVRRQQDHWICHTL